MNKDLETDFKIKQIAIVLCKQTLLLCVLVCLFLVVWQRAVSLDISKTCVAILLSMKMLPLILLPAVLLILLHMDNVNANNARLISVLSPIIKGDYTLSYKFNWTVLGIHALCMSFMASVYSCWIIWVYVILLDGVTLYVLSENKMEKGNKNTDDALKDVPIAKLQQDSLGRECFVNTFYNIINETQNNRNIILLNGMWGEGKTSVLNCLENLANDKFASRFVFRWVNPWQNYTKERFVNALLEEINLFLQYTYPKDTISPSLFEKLSFSVQPHPLININILHSKKSSNIGVNIKELSSKLKSKLCRLIIIVDDLDRLDKKQILDILSIVYLFSECNNIIFILSANQAKVEDSLTERQTADKGSDASSYYKAYQGYLEKIATNIITLPSILPEFLKKNLLQQLKNLQFKFTQEEKEHIPISLFHNLRDLKRTLQAFYNVMKQPTIQGEINPYHMLFVTFLYVFTPKIYTKIEETPSYWIKDYIENKTRNMKDNYAELNSYFESLLSLYPEKRNEIETIFLILNPEYYKIKLWEKYENKNSNHMSLEASMASIFSQSILKPFYNKDYFYRYFKHRLDDNTISDEIMHKHFEELCLIPKKEGAKQVMLFLNRTLETKISSYFNYLCNNLPLKDNPMLYSIIVDGVTSFLNNDLVKPSIKKIVIEEAIPQLIQNGNLSDSSLEYIFNGIRSIFFKVVIFYTAKSNLDLFKKLQLPSADSYTAESILKEECKYIEFQHARLLLYFWLRGWKDYPAPCDRRRKEETIKIFKQNEHYFWLVVGSELYEVLGSDAFPKRLEEYDKIWGLSILKEIVTALLEKTNIAYQEQLSDLQRVLER